MDSFLIPKIFTISFKSMNRLKGVVFKLMVLLHEVISANEVNEHNVSLVYTKGYLKS